MSELRTCGRTSFCTWPHCGEKEILRVSQCTVERHPGGASLQEQLESGAALVVDEGAFGIVVEVVVSQAAEVGMGFGGGSQKRSTHKKRRAGVWKGVWKGKRRAGCVEGRGASVLKEGEWVSDRASGKGDGVWCESGQEGERF